jgi:hypothetical protein
MNSTNQSPRPIQTQITSTAFRLPTRLLPLPHPSGRFLMWGRPSREQIMSLSWGVGSLAGRAAAGAICRPSLYLHQGGAARLASGASADPMAEPRPTERYPAHAAFLAVRVGDTRCPSIPLMRCRYCGQYIVCRQRTPDALERELHRLDGDGIFNRHEKRAD